MAHYHGHGSHVFVKPYPGYALKPWDYTLERGEAWGSSGRLIACFAEALPVRVNMAPVPDGIIEALGPSRDFRLAIANFGAPVTLVFHEQDGVTFHDLATYPKEDPSNEVVIATGKLVRAEYTLSVGHCNIEARSKSTDSVHGEVLDFSLLPVLMYATAAHGGDRANGYLSLNAFWQGALNVELRIQDGNQLVHTWEGVRAGAHVLPYHFRPPQLKLLRTDTSNATHTKILELYVRLASGFTQMLWSGPLRIDLPIFPVQEQS